MFDKNKLKAVLSVQSKSNKDEEMMEFLSSELLKIHKTTKLVLGIDDYGNMYITKGVADIYPCIVAHTDTVHSIRKKFQVIEVDGTLFAFDSDRNEQAGIGGDDKVGIYIALQALIDLPVIKIAFFRNEEIGCLGSKVAQMDFFDNVSMVLQADRKGNSDFIWYSNGVDLFDKEFKDATADIIKFHGYKLERGVATDVGQLKKNLIECAVVNISAGYYNAHSDREYVIISEVENCYGLFLLLFSELGNQRWVHKHVEPVYVPHVYTQNHYGHGSHKSSGYGYSKPSTLGGGYDYTGNGYTWIPATSTEAGFWTKSGTAARVFNANDPEFNPMNEAGGSKKKVKTVKAGTPGTTKGLSKSGAAADGEGSVGGDSQGGVYDQSNDFAVESSGDGVEPEEYTEVDYRICQRKIKYGYIINAFCPTCRESDDFCEGCAGGVICSSCCDTFYVRELRQVIDYAEVIAEYELQNNINKAEAPTHYCSCSMEGISAQEWMSCCRWCQG